MLYYMPGVACLEEVHISLEMFVNGKDLVKY